MSDFTMHNLLVGSWDLSTVTWGDKAKRSSETFQGAAVADLGAGKWGISFPTESHRADARATSGAEYVLSFWARADVAGDKIHSEVWGSLYRLDTELTTEWRQVVMPYGIRKADQRDVYFWGLGTNSGTVHVALPMCVRGDTPAAWAPAEGETLAGGGALMSANLWKAENVIPAEALEDGIYACSGNRGVRTNVTLDRLAANQTFHCGFSVNPGKDDKLHMTLVYRDAAGSVNNAFGTDTSAPAGKWTRVSQSVVVPSGMTVYQMFIGNSGNASGSSGWKVTNPTLSLGSPVCLASSAHTPYATQDHVSVTYATKASLKVTDDSVKAEVSARAQTDQNVADLSSRLTQTANSLSSEISDRKSAITTVTGLANAAQSTADSASEQTVELSSRLDQSTTDITATIESKVQTVQQGVDDNASDVKDLNDRLSDEIRTRKSFMRFSEESSDPTLTLGQTDSPAQVKLTNKQLQFLYLNTVVAYMSGDALLINNAKILQQLQLGGFAFVPRENGNLAFKWVGGDS